MKTLKLSALAACLFLFVSSCTKDDSSLSASRTASTEESIYGTSATGKTENNGKGQGVTGDNSASTDNGPQDLTSITISVSPNPVNQGSNYTVTGNVVFPIAVESGKVVIERAVKEDANGDDVFTSLEDAEDWVKFYEEEITSSRTSYEITRTATATEDPGFYGFRLHFIPAGGAGVKNGMSTERDLEVKSVCPYNTFTITPRVTADKYKDENGVIVDGVYEFTVTFDLTTKEEIKGIKFQGGATSGGKFEHVLTGKSDNLQLVHDNNQNTVLKWEGDLSECDKETISFKYKRKFSCPADVTEVTGTWTATVNGAEVHPPVIATHKCN